VRLHGAGLKLTSNRQTILVVFLAGAPEVAELHREKTELLEENASLKKGLDFMLGRYVSLGDRNSCRFSCPLDEQ
jgi:hypothetical protein